MLATMYFELSQYGALGCGTSKELDIASQRAGSRFLQHFSDLSKSSENNFNNCSRLRGCFSFLPSSAMRCFNASPESSPVATSRMRRLS